MLSYLREMGVKSQKIFRNEKGQGLVEYALILVLIAIAVVTALTAVGQKTSSVYTNINTNLNH